MAPHLQTDTHGLQAIQQLALDTFEREALGIARQFLKAHAHPETQAWHHGFLMAVECWGEPVGLAAAHGISKYVNAVLRFRSNGLSFQDPLDAHAGDYATEDEALMISVLHYMRRDKTHHAREAVAALTLGQMDPDIIRAGLSFAGRFSAGAPMQRAPNARPELRVVV
ncbi:MAG: hypothetical protein AAF718_12940 [Pseudomonadota bacterium]